MNIIPNSANIREFKLVELELVELIQVITDPCLRNRPWSGNKMKMDFIAMAMITRNRAADNGGDGSTKAEHRSFSEFLLINSSDQLE